MNKPTPESVAADLYALGPDGCKRAAQILCEGLEGVDVAFVVANEIPVGSRTLAEWRRAIEEGGDDA